MIPKEKKEEIKAAANIVKIIQDDGVTLKQQGVNYVGLCPFHSDRNASLVVSPSKQIFKCFACGESGDVFSWFMKRENMSLPEAVKKVAKENGIEVEEEELTPDQKREAAAKDSARAVIKANQALFEGYLASNAAATSYLAKREVSKDMISLFRLGFAPGQNEIKKHLMEQGYREDNMLAAGVIHRHAESGRTYDAYHDRIMFPIFNKRGEIVGYTGRDILGTQKAKYQNSNDSLLFKKGNEIYGLFQAKQSIVKEGFVYMCEGQFDVISLVQRGVTNVVAGSGTALTTVQIRLIKGFTNRLVMLLDGDKAGRKAAEKHISACVKAGFDVRCVALPDGFDPDDLAKANGDKVGEWLKMKTTSYVQFLCDIKLDGADAFTKGKGLRELVGIIANEPVEVQESLKKELAKFADTELATIEQIASNVKLPEKPETFKPGFYGMELVSEYIDQEDPYIEVTTNFEQFKKGIGNKQPFIYVHGVPPTNAVQELNTKVKRIIAHHIDWQADVYRESDSIRALKSLFTFGFTVDIDSPEGNTGFLYRYIGMYGDILTEDRPTPEQKSVYLARCMEMVSYAPKSIQTVNIKSWAEVLDLKLAEFRELLKPFNAERKASTKIVSERGDIGENILNYEPDRIPDYVEQNEEYAKMLKRHNYFPLLGKKSQQPVCYMFKTNGGTLKRVADFYMEPLFHVYSDDANENRRIIKLTSLYHPGEKYVEFPSNTFTKLSKLKERLIDKGAYNFDNGNASDFDAIWSYMSHKFPLVHEIKVFGQQPEGCFVFANGILHDVKGAWIYEPADELGLMSDGDMVFYSPAFSKVNIAMRQDGDRYEQDRWMRYTETDSAKRITFEHWAELMDEVYKVNDNGKWALLYAIMCAFRSDIRPIRRLFTALFFIGPTQSGKTQLAVSIRSLFILPDAPSFNLNSGTDAAFFSVLERFRDVPQVFEEYNDDSISEVKFQGLKQTVYDGEGKQKRKAATGNDIETTKVNAPTVILGQEAPQRDDGALANRVILCEVPKRGDIKEERVKRVFEELKQAEKDGLSYLLVEILKLRPIFQRHFAETQKNVERELEREVGNGSTSSGDQNRIITTVSLVVTTCKLMCQYAPYLKLPFTYEQFLAIAVAKIRSQVELISHTDKLANFFDTIDSAIDKGRVINGREYHIYIPKEMQISLKNGQTYTRPNPYTKLIYIRMSAIYDAYAECYRGSEHPLTKTTLEMNLRSHPAYIGQVNNHKFRWRKTVDAPVATPGVQDEEIDRAYMQKYVVWENTATSAIVMNYDLLAASMGKDFERDSNALEIKEVLEDRPF